jgi:hypothetical protein
LEDNDNDDEDNWFETKDNKKDQLKSFEDLLKGASDQDDEEDAVQ